MDKIISYIVIVAPQSYEAQGHRNVFHFFFVRHTFKVQKITENTTRSE